MRLKTLITILFLAAFTAAYGQDNAGRLRRVSSNFESFRYKEALVIIDSIVTEKQRYTPQELTEVYRMKAIAEFSIWDEETASRSFRELLKLNKSYQLDEKKTSPKILALFNKTKLEYLSMQPAEERPVMRDTVRIYTPGATDTAYVLVKEPDYNFIKSFAFPGWGHLSRGDENKGLVFVGLAAITAVTSIYFMYDCGVKERAYLNEINRAKIDAKYDAYNTAYQMRNASLILYAAMWLYAQVDYLGWNPFQPAAGKPTSPLQLRIGKESSSMFSLRYSF